MSSPQTNIKVGVVGYGLSARTFHIPFVKAHAELELAAVMQPEAYPDRSAGKDVSGVPIYHTMEDIVGKPELDLIVIASPSDTHHALAKDALRAGKHGKCNSKCRFGAYSLLLLTVIASSRRGKPNDRQKLRGGATCQLGQGEESAPDGLP